MHQQKTNLTLVFSLFTQNVLVLKIKWGFYSGLIIGRDQFSVTRLIGSKRDFTVTFLITKKKITTTTTSLFVLSNPKAYIGKNGIKLFESGIPEYLC